jgi:hypothetical protein
MKSRTLKKILSILSPGILSFLISSAQVADWSFNNVLTGTGSSTSVAGDASLGSTIAAGGAFNGGTVYYGEGSWPTSSTIDPNAYLEFSITPTAGHTLTVSSLVMQIRRSTTGTSGAGPNNWSLRSSLDGFATDISSGVLTANSIPATTVTLGVAFMNMPAKIIFRLYGYNATVSSGGLDRFVYDDIQAGGSTVLPLVFDYFKVSAENKSADISWKLSGDGNLSSLLIERASNGSNFENIKQYNNSEANNSLSASYTDPLDNPSGTYAYRIEMISNEGLVSYSAIQTVSFETGTGFQLQAINAGNLSSVSFRVNVEKAGNYTFSLYNLNGNKVVGKLTTLSSGTQVIQLENASLKSGIYVLLGENGHQKSSIKVMIL